MAIKNLSQSPHYYKQYKSNIYRAPRKDFYNIHESKSKKNYSKALLKNFKMNNNLLNYKKGKVPLGQKIIVTGKVIDTYGAALKNVIIEIWQANSAGKYKDEKDKHDAPIDPNFFGYGTTKTDKNGQYKFLTIIPGAYPWHNYKNAWRPKHIHFSLLNANIFSRLCTQMYFPDDSLLKYDPIFNSVPKLFRSKLVAKFDQNKNYIPNFLLFNFDIIMS